MEDSKAIELPKVEEYDIESLEESPIAKLKPNKQRFLHLYLSGGYKINDIAKLLNLNPVTIRGWLKKPEMKKIITEFQQEEDLIVKQGLKAMRMKAMYRLNELMDSKIDGVALTAVDRVLDRTGHKAVNEQKIDINIKTFEQRILDLADNTNDSDDDIFEAEYEVQET